MDAQVHERQNEELRKTDNRLYVIETMLEARNKRSDEMYELMKEIRMEFRNLPKEYVTVREYNAFQENIRVLLAARQDGMKSWQSWVMLLVPTGISAIIGLYVLLGGAN